MNDIYKPGDTVYSYFGHQSSLGVGTPATTITPTVRRNQNADITGTPTFTHLGNGSYLNTFLIPPIFQHGDQVTILAQATLTGTPAPPVPIWEGRLVQWGTDALPNAPFASSTGVPNARQVREEMDARSTHLSSMDGRIPGTPSTFGQIGTPSVGGGSVFGDLSHISSVGDATYLKTPALSDIPTTAAIKAAVWDDRVTGTTTGSITTTSVPLTGSDLSSLDNAYRYGFLLATSGALKGIGKKITAYDGASKTCTTQAFPAALAVGVSVAIIGQVPQ